MSACAIGAERWRPPKPLVGQRALEKILNRHTAVSCPESRLMVAVISAAIVDCLSATRSVRHQARRFVLGEDLTPWCDWVGLHPDFVRRVAQKAGYLAAEPAHPSGPRTKTSRQAPRGRSPRTHSAPSTPQGASA